MKFEDLRHDYLNITGAKSGWETIEKSLGSQNRNIQPVVQKGLITTAILLLSISTTVITAQKSKPGGSLYAVMVLSDKVYSSITGNYEATIAKRAQEVIDSQNSPQQLDEAAKQYSNTIEDSKKQADQKGEEKKFNETLQEQEEKLEQARKNNSENQQKLEEIIDHSQRIRGEVEGDRDETEDGENSNTEKRQNNGN
ncbi:MAG: hypothetical protein Q8P25_01910 [Candidatus Curtissbacteria bacterium]|nr:hypothetical protein [Candidatus Curtissbacteria bacterium]